ncbi:hypothetical protein ABPG72_002899, partial [Tetrahymena utriculariae]
EPTFDLKSNLIKYSRFETQKRKNKFETQKKQNQKIYITDFKFITRGMALKTIRLFSSEQTGHPWAHKSAGQSGNKFTISNPGEMAQISGREKSWADAMSAQMPKKTSA